MGSVDGKTQWQERHMVNPSIEQYLKTLGYIKIYNGPYLHPDALKEYDYFLSKEFKKKLSTFFTFVLYGALDAAPPEFKTKFPITTFGKWKVHWKIKSNNIIILDF